MREFPRFPQLPEFHVGGPVDIKPGNVLYVGEAAEMTITRKWLVPPIIRVRPHTDDMSQMLADIGVEPASHTGQAIRRMRLTIAVDMARDIDRTAMFFMSGRR
jgi:hypothetical protein